MVPSNAIQLVAATTNPLENPYLWQACRIVGRLHPGVPEEQARQEAERWLCEAIRAHPPTAHYEAPRVWLTDASEGLPTLRDAISAPLLILMAVVVAILLIACGNISGLLTVRGAARRREMATRLALGASRGRIARQLITESLLLSICGGSVGLALAYAFGRLSPAFMARFMPTLYGNSRQLAIAVDPDARVLLFAAGATIATGVIFGSLPAIQATGVSLIAAIKQNIPRRGTPFLAGDKMMVALQSALSLVLIVGGSAAADDRQPAIGIARL
jgi:predicted lysophospholipase L1 biosynthesis ABC-type transport system permease subunit